VNRNYRLTQSTDIKRVRRSGRSYAHPFIVLVVLPGEAERTLFGVTAGRSVGGAVQRNRAKRLIREAVRPLLTQVHPGMKLVLIARKPILEAEFPAIQYCLKELLTRAEVLNDSNE
jgi:ribonuclease P protein component